ncbi:MAG: hypothetical protein HY279_09235 [Nitrospinae bacterium]|nr:hypothetical protein [Nitrospinota bacterium]
MKRIIISLYFAFCILYPHTAVFAVETAPRISDKEIIEKLSALDAKIDREIANVRGDIKELRAEIKRLDEGQKALQQQINDLKESTRQQINDLRELIKWMLGLFISIALTVMVIMGRILWNQQKKLTQIDTSLEAQKEEISFIKTLIEKLQTLIEKLLPPRGVL